MNTEARVMKCNQTKPLSVEIRLLLYTTSRRSLTRARSIALLSEFASFWNDMRLSTVAVQKFCSPPHRQEPPP